MERHHRRVRLLSLALLTMASLASPCAIAKDKDPEHDPDQIGCDLRRVGDEEAVPQGRRPGARARRYGCQPLSTTVGSRIMAASEALICVPN